MTDLPARPSSQDDSLNTLDMESFGRRLRSTRKQLGWTLMQLSERSGVSITTISRAERGMLALGYANLAALSSALQIDMSKMLSKESTLPSALPGTVVTRANEGASYRGQRFIYEFLGAGAGKKMVPVIGTVHARDFNGPEDYARHPGDEFVYILSGTVDVYFETGEKLRLGRGDSLYYDSRIGHAYVSVGRLLARILAVLTAESDSMQMARGAKESDSLR